MAGIRGPAGRFPSIGGLLDRLQLERTHRWREEAAHRPAVEARADAWLAEAAYHDIRLVQDDATTDAYAVAEILVPAPWKTVRTSPGT